MKIDWASARGDLATRKSVKDMIAALNDDGAPAVREPGAAEV
jgi:hypothetical protein